MTGGSFMTKGKNKKANKSVRGWRIKKQGGQSGGSGYNERMDGKAHERKDQPE
jgi:hypothetical protein